MKSSETSKRWAATNPIYHEQGVKYAVAFCHHQWQINT
uniref:Uncharacterized protein n=1 Tax=Anguilla anguilla TaxID=7936 RepID=A0A0E9SF40_ANGAN